MLEFSGNSPALHTTVAPTVGDSCSGVVAGDGGTGVEDRSFWLRVEHSLVTRLTWIREGLATLRREDRPLATFVRLDGTVW